MKAILKQAKRRIKKLFRTPLTKAIVTEMWVSFATFFLLLYWMVMDLNK